MMHQSTDPFFEPYDREQIAYGEEPSPALAAHLRQVGGSGRAFDLGAGAGRDTVALASVGFQVTAVDLSGRGLARVRQRAAAAGVADRVTTQVADVRDVEMPAGTVSAIVATTVLDHVPAGDAERLWNKIVAALAKDGVLYVQVHTTEDPGSDQLPGLGRAEPVSETADAVINYFPPNQLARWACNTRSGLRVLRYEERLEWDRTHGPEHLHGKAELLAVRFGHHPAWYGHPAAFPRRDD